MRYKFTKKNDIDKLDPYLKILLHMLANKPLSDNVQSKFNFSITIFFLCCYYAFFIIKLIAEQANVESSKKKQKKGKKN
jgi:hypothetical protein